MDVAAWDITSTRSPRRARHPPLCSPRSRPRRPRRDGAARPAPPVGRVAGPTRRRGRRSWRATAPSRHPPDDRPRRRRAGAAPLPRPEEKPARRSKCRRSRATARPTTASSRWPRPPRNGFDAFFRGDHYLGIDRRPGVPAHRLWTTLAGVAIETIASSWDADDRGPFRVPAVVTTPSPPSTRCRAGGWCSASVRLVRRQHKAFGSPFADRRVLRPARRGDEDHQRAMDDARGGSVQPRRQVLAAQGLPELPRARPEAAPRDRDRRHRPAADPADGCPARGRVQQRGR